MDTHFHARAPTQRISHFSSPTTDSSNGVTPPRLQSPERPQTPSGRDTLMRSSAPSTDSPLIFDFSPSLDREAREHAQRVAQGLYSPPRMALSNLRPPQSIGQTFSGAAVHAALANEAHEQQRSDTVDYWLLRQQLVSAGSRFEARMHAAPQGAAPSISHSHLAPSPSFARIRRERPQTPYARPLVAPRREGLMGRSGPGDISPFNLGSPVACPASPSRQATREQR